MQKNVVYSITMSAIMIALVTVCSFVTSSYIPKIPLINGHPDFWYAIAVFALVFIPNMSVRVCYIVALPFVLMSVEFNSYAGFLDYFLELIAPLWLALISMVYMFKNKWICIFQAIMVLFMLMAWRILFMTISGVVIYDVPWKASLAYNAPNVVADIIVCAIAIPLVFLRLLKIKKWTE